MWRKLPTFSHQQIEQSRQVRKVSRYQHIARFRDEPVAHRRWRIARLEIADRAEVRERVARPPAGLGGLPRTQLAAVPDDGRLRAVRGELRGQTLHRDETVSRQRPARIDLGSDRFSVMN